MAPTRERAVVIGSGPAGVACAHALAERGLRPLLLDGGRRLEPGRGRLAERLAAGEHGALVDELRRSFPVELDALPLKPVFGSLYAYAVDDPALPLRAEGVFAVPSLAVGGLSSVWGAAVLPFAARDLGGWPFDRAELDAHYRAVLSFVPLAAERDALEEEFPLYAEPRPLEATPQVAALLRRLRESGPALRAAGVRAGRARLAVSTGLHPYGSPCRYAGLCMLGCPHGSIYNAAATLERLRAEDRAVHRPGAVVERLEERPDEVVVRLAGGGELRAERVFVAAGALSTTRLLLESIDAYDRPVPLLDSQYFTFPLLALRRRGRVSAASSGNTLAQAFLELRDPAVSANGVHVQLYGFNDLMLRALAARLRLPPAAVERTFQPLLGRLLYAQGYLHSSASPGLRAELRREGGRGTLVLLPGDGPVARPAAEAVVARLRSLSRLLGAVPVARLLQVWPPGRGFHVGGSFPMRAAPSGLESDSLGRPAGLRRVHVVDASAFPAIPATTITLSAMANAHRIGAAAAEAFLTGTVPVKKA